MSNFPQVVRTQAAPGVIGDFCDDNPRSTIDAGQGAFVAGPNGVAIGQFAWIAADGVTVNSTGVGAPDGFVRRDQQSIIYQYLQETTMVIPAGFPVTLFNAGGFFVLNSGSTTSARGNVAYANNANGQITFNTAGNPPTSASVTAQLYANLITDATLAANSATGSISSTVLTVSAIGAGSVLAAGQTLSGGNSTVGYITPNTTIVGQLTGTAGGIGTYTVSISQNVASTAIGVSGGGMTVTTMGTGTVAVGQTATASGNLAAGTTVTAVGTGNGTNTGTYALSAAPTAAGSSIAVTLSGGTLDVTAVASGVLNINDTVTGGTIAAGTYLQSFVAGSGTLGGVGNYLVNTSTTSASGTVTVAAGTATKWVASSVAAPGELAKMTTWVNG